MHVRTLPARWETGDSPPCLARCPPSTAPSCHRGRRGPASGGQCRPHRILIARQCILRFNGASLGVFCGPRVCICLVRAPPCRCLVSPSRSASRLRSIRGGRALDFPAFKTCRVFSSGWTGRPWPTRRPSQFSVSSARHATRRTAARPMSIALFPSPLSS